MHFRLSESKNNFERYVNVESLSVIDFCPNLKPFVSIMIPTYKRPHLLKFAIDSALYQETDVNFEVVIVDNDYESEFSKYIEAILNEYRGKNIRYFRNQKNIGMFGNWNRCIELARGKWLTILNDDDILDLKWLSVMLSQIRDKTMLLSEYKKVYSSQEILAYKSDFHLSKLKVKKLSVVDLFLGNISNGTLGCLYEKKSMLSLGGFDESLYPTSDYDFNFRYWYKFGALKVCNQLALFRWEENNSLKPEVMKKTLSNDYLMRKKYIRDIFGGKKFKCLTFDFFAFLLLVKRSYDCKKYNVFFDIKRDFSDLDVPKNTFFLRVLRFFPYRVILVLLLLTNIS